MKARGKLIVISGPSGAGKGTIVNALVFKDVRYKLSISATTRKPRLGEVNGANYYFMENDEFESMIKNKELLEFACVHGKYYGTPKKYADEMLDNGYDVILEIDVQGALQVKKNAPDACLIFVTPPSLEELEARLRGRRTDDEDDIRLRMKNARDEYEQARKYDYIVVNEDVKTAVKVIERIISCKKYEVKYNLEKIERILEGSRIQ